MPPVTTSWCSPRKQRCTCVSFRNKNVSCQGRLFHITVLRTIAILDIWQWSSSRAIILYLCDTNILTYIRVYVLIVPIANFACFYSIERCAFCLVSCPFKVVSLVKTPNVRYLILIRAMRAFKQSAQRLLLVVFFDSSLIRIQVLRTSGGLTSLYSTQKIRIMA